MKNLLLFLLIVFFVENLTAQTSEQMRVINGVGPLIFSPDGQYLACSRDEKIVLLNPDDTSTVRIFEEVSKYTQDLEFSHDGQYLASTNADTIIIWKVSDGSLIRKILLEVGYKELSFSPDGKYIAAGDLDKIKYWRIDDGSLVHEFREKVEEVVWTFAFSSEYLIGGYSSGIKYWRTDDGSLERTIPTSNSVSKICISPDGQYLINSVYNKIELRNLNDGSLIRTFVGPSTSIASLCFSADGQFIAVGYDNFTVKIWRVADGVMIHSENTWARNSLSFSSDGKYFACGYYKEAIIWDYDYITSPNSDIMRIIDAHSATIRSIDFNHDGEHIVSGSEDGTVKIWNINNGSLVRKIDGNINSKNYAVFSPDGQYLAYSSSQNTYITRLSDSSLISTIDLQGAAHLAFSPDGNNLATVLFSSVENWSVNDGGFIREFGNPSDLWYYHAIAFSPDGQYIAGGGSQFKLWQVSDGSLIRTFQNYISITLSIYSLDFSPDGQYIVTGGADGVIKLWRVSDGAIVRSITLVNQGVSNRQIQAVKFSPDGRFIISSDLSHSIILWRVSDGAYMRKINWSNLKDSYSMDFSPDGQILAIADDQYIALWNFKKISDQISVVNEQPEHPEHYSLNQNYPNPFNPSTNISFSLAKQTRVRLNVYNMLGQQVARLLDEELSGGEHLAKFSGENLPSGIYIYRLETEDFAESKKMILLK
ncbi:MAG TPA: T9SS type A sorting domain-containing protein [Ignavibacteriales bacterium]|nr:T9SS type A sorting domain-containing protein [Ignavibacteriales bacterium]